MAEPQQFLVRVKRRRNAEPVPELLVQPFTVAAKRRRADATLRLVDSVGSAGWCFDGGLPANWMQGSSIASETAAHPGGQNSTFDAPCPQQRVFREASRRIVVGTYGEPVQLVDVEQFWEQPPQRKNLVSSVFMVDGQALVATPTGLPAGGTQQAEWIAPKSADNEDEEFVWDVYALSDYALGGPDYGTAAFSARVQLAAPVFEEEEGLEEFEDLEDIDDSQSEGGSWAGSGAPHTSSSDAGFEDGDEDRPWADVLD